MISESFLPRSDRLRSGTAYKYESRSGAPVSVAVVVGDEHGREAGRRAWI